MGTRPTVPDTDGDGLRDGEDPDPLNPTSTATFRRGDANGDGRMNLADPINVLTWLFVGGKEPPCLDAADADDSGSSSSMGIDISDPVLVLGYLFLGGRAPAEPLAACAADPTEDTLDCKSFPACGR